MPLTTSQKINETKRSFHKYLADNLTGVAIDYDDANFVPPTDSAFVVIRYRSVSRESCGIGGVLTGDSPSLTGYWRHIEAHISIYKRDDPQKADIGTLYDTIESLLEVSDITLYDFTDPENPASAGKIYLDTLKAPSGPSPLDGRIFDNLASRELADAAFSWMSLGVLLSVLVEC
jgi:hypothetical protein